MTERELYIETVKFNKPDKIPMVTMGPRESTIEVWQKQGLPKGVDWFVELCHQLKIDYNFPKKEKVELGVKFEMMPMFEEKILEHTQGHYILQDWMGNIIEISDKFDFSYIREARDFVTRKWHKFPVESFADFEMMKERYDPESKNRFPDDFNDVCLKLRERDYLATINISGPFWQMREWCGFEPLCILFVDNIGLVEEMISFWSDYITSMLEKILSKIVIDSVHISEDMAYKGSSMISPSMTRKYLMPTWKRWGTIVSNAGVPIYDMDSDGFIDQLIPLWIESGFNLCDPIEVAAGCDIHKYRKMFGRSMAYSGGIDKRCIARGGIDLENEISRIEPVVKGGGYIPGCDHGIPPDISWTNMKHFGRLWAELTGWL